MRSPRQADNRSDESGSDRVVLARFGAAHGVRGEIRLKSFTERPKAALNYGPLQSPDGRQFELTAARQAAGKATDMLVVQVAGVNDRVSAEALNGVELAVLRRLLPETEADDFYHADLIGLAAETDAGEALGTITAIHNHGAGDLLEIGGAGHQPVLVPFTRQMVPIVDIPAGRIVVEPRLALYETENHEEPD